MNPLNEIKSFPVQYGDLLASQFGVISAVAFFEHGTGIQAALKLSTKQLVELMMVIEGNTSSTFVKNGQQPVSKNERDTIVD